MLPLPISCQKELKQRIGANLPQILAKAVKEFTEDKRSFLQQSVVAIYKKLVEKYSKCRITLKRIKRHGLIQDTSLEDKSLSYRSQMVAFEKQLEELGDYNYKSYRRQVSSLICGVIPGRDWLGRIWYTSDAEFLRHFST